MARPGRRRIPTAAALSERCARPVFRRGDQLSRHGLALLDDTTTLDAGRQYARKRHGRSTCSRRTDQAVLGSVTEASRGPVDLDVLFRGVLGVDQAAFYAGWLMWVKTKYC